MRPSRRPGLLAVLAVVAGVFPPPLDASPPAGGQPRPDAVPPDAFVTALAADPRGTLWAATEDLGLYCVDGGGRGWSPDTGVVPPKTGDNPDIHRFTTASGLSDDTACALAVDSLGRLWAGTLNHGVSVWNGEAWRHYDVLDGPLGERVFGIACNPADGDVWIATSAGLTRYEQKRDRWRHYTRADGLPSDPAHAVAFDRKGGVYVGTQCHGVAFARAVPVNNALEYYKWSVAAAPDRFGPGGCSPVPLESAGAGLPSSLINDVRVGRDGTVWAATAAGLAWSRNGGASWRYLRGRDWEAKVRGLLGGPPKGWRPDAGRPDVVNLLPEDRVTCLAEDDQGLLWLGHWRKGYSVLDPRTLKVVCDASSDPDSRAGARDYVLAIHPVPGEPPWIGWYGGGLTRGRGWSPGNRAVPPKTGDNPDFSLDAIPLAPPVGGTPRHPSPAAPPTEAELRALLREVEQAVEAGKRDPDPPKVVPLPDDWRTRGDWLGRYGRYWACLAAICAPDDYVWGAGERYVPYRAFIGRNCTPDDSIRYWVHWLYTTNPRTLELPPVYLDSRVVKGLTTRDRNRRQAEWDDHGETYPMEKDGPHLYCTIDVPEGTYILSLYDFNKDGHTGPNRWRDYTVSIRPGAYKSVYDIPSPGEDVSRFHQRPELARARIHQFWGGVWKRFRVRGPAIYTIEVDRNGSFNTILAGVFLDSTQVCPESHFRRNMSGEGVARRYLESASVYEESKMRGLSVMGSGGSGVDGLAADYYLRQFARYEKGVSSLGLMPARELEQRIRWDRVSYRSSRLGRPNVWTWFDILNKRRDDE